MAPTNDSTAPPTPTPPPAPSLADLYGPQGNLVAAPPTTPAGISQHQGAGGSWDEGSVPDESQRTQLENTGALPKARTTTQAASADIKKTGAVVQNAIDKPILAAEDSPELQVPVLAGKTVSQYLHAHGHTNAAKAVDAYTGVAEGENDFVTAMSSPKNLAMMYSLGRLKQAGAAGLWLDKLVNAKFSYDSIKAAYEDIPGVRAALAKGDVEGATRAATSAAGSAVVGVTAGDAATEGMRPDVAGAGVPDEQSTLKIPKTEKAPAATTPPTHIDMADLGGKELRGPTTFGRTGGRFSQAVNAAFDAARKTEAENAKPQPEIKAEGPEWDRTHSAYIDGKKVGSVGYKVDPDGRAQIYGSNVDPKLRGQGIGQKLYQSVIGEAEANGADRITSDSTNTTPDANRVWDKLKEKGAPIEDITHPNGKPGYQVTFNKPTVDLSDLGGTEAGETPDHLLTGERQSALKQPYTITVKNEDGTHRIEMIDAFSSKDALKQAQQKFPEGGEWQAISAPGKSEASTEYSVPKGKLLSMRAGGDNETSVHSIRHELGHALVGQNEGMTQEGMQRHTHPDVPSGVNLGVRWNANDLFDRTTGQIKADKLTPVIRTFMGGIAADELFNDIPRAANHNFMDMGHPQGDGGQAYKFLRAAGYDHDGAVDFMHTAIDDAKAHLQKPAVSDIIKENEGVREPNLSKQYHYSAERLSQMHAEAQRRLGNEVNESGTNNAEGNAAGKPDVASGQGEAAPANDQGPAKKVTTHEVNPEEEGDESFNFGANEKSPTADIPESKGTATAPDWANKAADMAKKQGGGFTIDPRTGEAPKTGYQIEAGTEQRPAPLDHDATPQDIQDFYEKNKELFDQHPELHVGGYGKELNLSANVSSLKDAQRVAKKLDQISIWDNAKGEEIPTGGKSERTYYPNYPLADRIAEANGKPLSNIPNFEKTPQWIYDRLNDDQRAFLKDNPKLQQKVVDEVHKQALTTEEAVNTAAVSSKLNGWWRRFNDVFNRIGDAGKTKTTAKGVPVADALKAFHSALSGNKMVEDANNLSWGAFYDWMKAGQPTDRPAIDKIIKNNGAAEEGKLGPTGEPKKGNAAMSDSINKKTGEPALNLDTTSLWRLVNSPEMQGKKAFNGNIWSEQSPIEASGAQSRKLPSMVATTAGGNLDQAVIDSIMGRFFGRTKETGGLLPRTQQHYIADTVFLRGAADQMGIPTGEAQEQIWGTTQAFLAHIRNGLTPVAAAAKILEEGTYHAGKDYADIILKDPEVAGKGGYLDKLKTEFGIGPGSEGITGLHEQTRSAEPPKEGKARPINASDLAKTGERIHGTLSEKRQIDKEAPAEEIPLPAPKLPTAPPPEDKYTAALKAGDAAAKAKREANMKKGLKGLK